MNNPLHYARYWRELYKTLDGLRSNPQMAAHYLSFHRDQMVESKGRLLSMGMDISDINDPTVVPIPLKRHPRTEPEKREFEAQVEFLIDLHFLAFAVTAAGANIVYSAVGDEPLIEVLSGNVEGYPREVSRAEVSSWISKTNLEYLAVACALWLLEPVGEMKEEVSRIDAAAWKRMLYATEIVTLNKVSQNIDEDRSGEKQRALAADAMTGWALSNISLGGQAGGRIRRALGAETPKGMQYARLLEELPGAMLQAWGDRPPEEPLKSTGNREMNLARRVAAMIEETAKPEAETELIETLSNDENDELLQDFELREDATRQLNALEKAAGLSPQQAEIWQSLRDGKEIQEIAAELRISRNQVDVQRSNAVGKLKRAAGL